MNDRPFDDITVVEARFGGVYEGAKWLAFPLAPDKLPTGWNAEDLTCRAFWDSYTELVGKGDTPNTAVYSLEQKLSLLSSSPALSVPTDPRD